MWLRCKGKLSFFFLMTKLAMVSNSKLGSADPPHQQQQPWSPYSLHLCFLLCEMFTKVRLLLCRDNSAWTGMDTEHALMASCYHGGWGWRRTLSVYPPGKHQIAVLGNQSHGPWKESVRCEFKMSADTDLFRVLSPAWRKSLRSTTRRKFRVFQVDIYTPQQTV